MVRFRLFLQTMLVSHSISAPQSVKIVGFHLTITFYKQYIQMITIIFLAVDYTEPDLVSAINEVKKRITEYLGTRLCVPTDQSPEAPIVCVRGILSTEDKANLAKLTDDDSPIQGLVFIEGENDDDDGQRFITCKLV